METLTEKRKKFCEEYITHGNATKAARDAGYSYEHATQTGYKLKQDPRCIEYMEKLLEQGRNEFTTSFAEIVRAAKEIAYDPDGSRRDRMDAIKFLANLGGFMIQKQDINVKAEVSAVDALDNLSDEELQAILEKVGEDD